MANISKINVNNHEYNIKDATARAALGTYTGSSAIPTALNNKVGYADYRTVTENSTTKHYIYFYKNDSDAPVNASSIPSNYICKIDAAPFIKDGMVSSVAITNGNLVITWNSDSTGVTSPTSIPLTDIFNAANYYDKDDVDGLIANVEAGLVDVVDNLTTDDGTKALSAKQGKNLQDNKANKSELSITAVTGKTDTKNIQLKSGTAQEVLIAHQTIGYDTTNNRLTTTINGTTTPIVTASDIVTYGGGYKKPSGGIPASDIANDVVKTVSVNNGTAISPNSTTGNVNITAITGIYAQNQGITGGANGIATIPDYIIYGIYDNGDFYSATYDIVNQTWQYSDNPVSGKTNLLYVDITNQKLYAWDGSFTEIYVGVTNVSYNTSSKKIQNTINGTVNDVVTLSTVATSGSYSDLSGKPTNLSSFTNDVGYQTSSQVSSSISSAVYGSYTESTETLYLTLPAFTETLNNA